MTIIFLWWQIDYPASRGYIFAVWAVMGKVASAKNRSNPSRNLDSWINFKKRVFFLFLAGLNHCVNLAWVLCHRSELTQFFYSCKTRHLTTDLTIDFPYKLHDKFCTCTIENWTVVSRGYFSHASSHRENVAFA